MTPLPYRASDSAVYYRNTQSVNWGRALSALICSLPLLAALGWMYILALGQIRNQHFYFIAVFGLAMVAAGISNRVVAIGRVKRPMVAVLIGVMVAIVLLWAVWVCYLHDVFRGRLHYWSLISRPGPMLRLIQQLPGLITLAINNQPVETPTLILAWIAEAATIAGGAIFGAVKAPVGASYPCQVCGEICKSISGFPSFAERPVDEVRKLIADRNFEALGKMELLKDEDAPQIDLRLKCCPRCGATNILTVSLTSWYVDDKGVRGIHSTPIVADLLITKVEADTIISLQPAEPSNTAETGLPETSAE